MHTIASEGEIIDMSVKIFAMTHKEFDVPKNPMYVPLHVGHKQAAKDFGYLGDDTGDNISDLNCYYAELSGVYWVWKNCHDADYVGICHYRRYLTSEENYVFTERQYEEILQRYDIMTTKQLELPNSYRYGFGAHHRVETLDETGNIIREKYPEYYDTFLDLVHKNKTYFGNIMAAKKELFDEYAEWLFSILFELQERIELRFTDDYHKRVFGFISEFLLYVWVTAKKLRAYECRVAIIGEKAETREIKEKMAEYFARKDIAGAKEYFAGCLSIRPDVLMEASDITGECKLCLQAVSTADMELAASGTSFLDGRNTYREVIDFLLRLNAAVQRAVREEAQDWEEDRRWIREAQVSDIALLAAIRIHAPKEEERDRAYRRLR